MILGGTGVTRRRFAAQVIGTDGRPSTSAYTDVTIVASVQPSPGTDADMLPEGIRSSERLRFYSESELAGENQHAGLRADEIITGGKTYRLYEVARWSAVIPHYRAIGVRVPE